MSSSNTPTNRRTRALVASMTTAGCLTVGLPLAGLGTVGATSAQTPTTEQTTTTVAKGGHRAALAQRVAKALGVSVEQIKTAAKASREAVKASGSTDPVERRQIAKEAFASSLGKTVDEVDAALVAAILSRVDSAEDAGKITAEQAQKIRDKVAEGPESLRAAIKERIQNRILGRLDKAVEAGKITQAQADEIQSRVTAGEPLLKVLRDLGLGRKLRHGG